MLQYIKNTGRKASAMRGVLKYETNEHTSNR